MRERVMNTAVGATARQPSCPQSLLCHVGLRETSSGLVLI